MQSFDANKIDGTEYITLFLEEITKLELRRLYIGLKEYVFIENIQYLRYIKYKDGRILISALYPSREYEMFGKLYIKLTSRLYACIPQSFDGIIMGESLSDIEFVLDLSKCSTLNDSEYAKYLCISTTSSESDLDIKDYAANWGANIKLFDIAYKNGEQKHEINF